MYLQCSVKSSLLAPAQAETGLQAGTAAEAGTEAVAEAEAGTVAETVAGTVAVGIVVAEGIADHTVSETDMESAGIAADRNSGIAVVRSLDLADFLDTLN